MMHDCTYLIAYRVMPRRLILHLDDLGLCRGANTAFVELVAREAITCGSVMVPAPHFSQIASEARARPGLDIGVHLTLTAEWKTWRWGPISTRSRASGLIDSEGFFPRTVAELRQRLVVDAAEAELRAQIDRALAEGIDVTHLDAHMGCTMLPELMPCYARLAVDYGLPLFLMRKPPYVARSAADWQASIEALERQGLPIVDHVVKTVKAPADDPAVAYRAMLADLPPGLTCMLLHCNAPGDIEAIAPEHAAVRTAEYALFRSGAPTRWLREMGADLTGFRALRESWRARIGYRRDSPPASPAGRNKTHGP